MRAPRLYPAGIALILIGIVLLCLGGSRMARSPEFLAAYRLRFVDAVYAGRPMPAQDVDYFGREAARLRSGCVRAGVGLGCLMAGVVIARLARPLPPRRKRGTVGLFSRQREVLSRTRQRTGHPPPSQGAGHDRSSE